MIINGSFSTDLAFLHSSFFQADENVAVAEKGTMEGRERDKKQRDVMRVDGEEKEVRESPNPTSSNKSLVPRSLL